MKKLLEIGAHFEEGWHADNKQLSNEQVSATSMAPEKHQLYFAKEKRRGKTVTLVKPFHLSRQELQVLLTLLKKRLGTGGTLKENTLEFQGEVSQKLRLLLEELHYRFRK